jgi:polyhydroxybutyrate depolymerase
MPVLKNGIWTERTAQKLQQERQQVEQLLSAGAGAELNGQMDWAYFDFMAQQRLRIERQQNRAMEIAAYAEDLAHYQPLALYTKRPVTVINSDFETQQIRQNPEQKSALLVWQQQGDLWSEQQAKASGGQYIHLTTTEHLLMFQQPELILKAVDWLMALPEA